jgi:protein MpaA
VLTRSVSGVDVSVFRFPSASPDAANVLLFAGIHGDEGTTVAVMRRFTAELEVSAERLSVNVFVVGLANPDGLAAHTRTNANKVDLNRNFPAKNWKTSMRKTQYWNGPEPLSEPESKALHDLVLELRPVRILSLHSIKAGRHGNNFDGPAQSLAELLASKNGYNVLPTIGYPTPGSFGSWAGIDLGIPTITLELPSNISGESAWKQNREALWAFVRGQ